VAVNQLRGSSRAEKRAFARLPRSDERPASYDHPSAPVNVSSVHLSLSIDHQADLGWKANPPCLQVANFHHASCQRVVVEAVELQCNSPSSPSNDCCADRGQDTRHPGLQSLNVHQADPAHVVFEYVNLPSSDRRPDSWFQHQVVVRRGVWIGSPSLPVRQSPERRSCQVTGPQVSRTGVQGQVPRPVDWRSGVQGPVVISRVTNFPTHLGVLPDRCSIVGVLFLKSGNKFLFKSMNGLFHTLSHASPFDIHKSNPSQASPFDIHKSNLHLPCTVPGTNLIVATKRGLEYALHITVSVQNVPREDD